MSPSARHLPLPPTLARLVDAANGVNRSLLFDKGVDTYNDTWSGFRKADKKADPRAAERHDGKLVFLESFREWFQRAAPNPEFVDRIARRQRALIESLGAREKVFTTGSRLVIGLGLPQPTQTGFLLDRLTGCPYLPGSSLKGLLRAAVRAVQRGDIDGDAGVWSAQAVARIFGPELSDGDSPASGIMTFYDAFPETWPTLEVDVLTPHYGNYYSEEEQAVPGDWHNPVPVPFLTLAPGTPFRFYFSANSAAHRRNDLAAEMLDRDLDSTAALLATALDWLGVGGKRSAGYGFFTAGRVEAEVRRPTAPQPAPAHSPATRTLETAPSRRVAPPARVPGDAVWKDVALVIEGKRLLARKSRSVAAEATPEVVPPRVVAALKAKKKVRARIVVAPGVGAGTWRVVRVEEHSLDPKRAGPEEDTHP